MNWPVKKFIKAVLEMGGSNPVIVFADADLDKAAAAIVSKRFMFCGQTCDADKRLLVEAAVADEIILKLKQKIEAITDMGPLVAKRQLQLLESQVKEAYAQGAKIEAQGKIDNNLAGAYFPPTLLSNIEPSMRIWREEVFGPVLPLMTFTSEAEAVEIANNTQYGLGSQVFTKDRAKALRVAKQLEAGNVDINGVGHFRPTNPFGGYKQSGMGREHGLGGFRELCQIKVVSRDK
jgi:succinate-semialdehyde dehydrogenase/glutarate-semialdehyde dehydrogenase